MKEKNKTLSTPKGNYTTISVKNDVKRKVMDLQFTLMIFEHDFSISQSDVLEKSLKLLKKELKKKHGKILKVDKEVTFKSGRKK